MPITGDFVAAPKDGADPVDGLVADSKAPFAARLVRFVKMGVELFSAAALSVRAFSAVSGKECK